MLAEHKETAAVKVEMMKEKRRFSELDYEGFEDHAAGTSMVDVTKSVSTDVTILEGDARIESNEAFPEQKEKVHKASWQGLDEAQAGKELLALKP